MATHSSNEYLSRSKMKDNAEFIYDYFSNMGWSDNAICAMLGNMERESTINPGLWQNQDEGNTSLGLGLVQWTPATKLINWCNSWGLDYLDLEAQCIRINYELQTGDQYYPTDDFPETFEEFSESDEDLDYLTECFLKNYERAGVEALDERIDNAYYWYEYLIGEEPDEPDEPEPEPEPVNLYKKRKHYKFHIFNRKRRIF